MPEFNCDSCGLCCKHIGLTKVLARYALPDGSCRYLGKDNRCIVYNDRPLICQVKGFWERNKTGLSLEEWYKANEEACKELKDADAKSRAIQPQ